MITEYNDGTNCTDVIKKLEDLIASIVRVKRQKRSGGNLTGCYNRTTCQAMGDDAEAWPLRILDWKVEEFDFANTELNLQKLALALRIGNEKYNEWPMSWIQETGACLMLGKFNEYLMYELYDGVAMKHVGSMMDRGGIQDWVDGYALSVDMPNGGLLIRSVHKNVTLLIMKADDCWRATLITPILESQRLYEAALACDEVRLMFRGLKRLTETIEQPFVGTLREFTVDLIWEPVRSASDRNWTNSIAVVMAGAESADREEARGRNLVKREKLSAISNRLMMDCFSNAITLTMVPKYLQHRLEEQATIEPLRFQATTDAAEESSDADCRNVLADMRYLAKLGAELAAKYKHYSYDCGVKIWMAQERLSKPECYPFYQRTRK